MRAWWCCTLHGLRVFPDISQNVFREHESGLHYDLPLDGRIETSGFAAVASSSLAQNGKVRITIIRAPQQATVLAVRTPSWASSVAIRIKGSDVHMPLEDGYVGAKRTWSPGDQVEVAYAMNLHSLPQRRKSSLLHVRSLVAGRPGLRQFPLLQRDHRRQQAHRRRQAGCGPCGSRRKLLRRPPRGYHLPLRTGRISRPACQCHPPSHCRANRPAHHLLGTPLSDQGPGLRSIQSDATAAGVVNTRPHIIPLLLTPTCRELLHSL